VTSFQQEKTDASEELQRRWGPAKGNGLGSVCHKTTKSFPKKEVYRHKGGVELK
jgi:hypothetical protein